MPMTIRTYASMMLLIRSIFVCFSIFDIF